MMNTGAPQKSLSYIHTQQTERKRLRRKEKKKKKNKEEEASTYEEQSRPPHGKNRGSAPRTGASHGFVRVHFSLANE